jgi:hypothetical protein
VNHKGILAGLIVGFCLIFVGSLLGSISLLSVNHARLQYTRNEIGRDDYYNAIDISNTLNFVEQLLQIVGGLVLSVSSAVGAFIVEDKYAKLGLLLFSALVTVFILTTVMFRLVYPPTA